MDANAGITPNDAATLSLFNPYGGIGVGGYGAGYGTREAYNGTVANANILANRDIGQSGIRQISDDIQNNTICNRFIQIDDKISALAMQNAECCCDLKQQIAQSETRLTVLIKDNRIADLEAELLKCQTQSGNTTVCNTIINALSPYLNTIASNTAG